MANSMETTDRDAGNDHEWLFSYGTLQSGTRAWVYVDRRFEPPQEGSPENRHKP